MSGPYSYNLLSKPWIPVIWHNDAAEPREPKVGIREALNRSHEIRCISHTSPFIEFGLYRLLITIVLDAYTFAGKRPTTGKVRALLSEGRLDLQVFIEYFGKYGEGFDLWSSRLPFLQRSVENDDGKKPDQKPIITLFAAIPSGTNVTHWHHFGEDEAALTEDIAAQFLTTVSPFNFKVKPGEARTLAGDPPLYALVLGRNLFDTIILNLPGRSGRITAKQEKDNGPAWRTRLDLNRLPKTPTITQGFTWPVRIIRLEIDGVVVAKAVNQAAYKKPTAKAKAKTGILYDAKYAWRDPNAGIETTAENIAHIKARPGVPVWRDVIPLFLVASEGEALRNDKRRSRPEVISNALRVLDTPQFRVAVYGMRKKGGGSGDVKVEEWFRSILTIPTEVARDSRISAQAIDAFKTTQRVADALQTALRMLRPSSEAKKTTRKATHWTEVNCVSHFWQRLELPLNNTYLVELAGGNPKAKETLWNVVRKEARDAFILAKTPQRRTADGLFRIANAGNWFEGRLNRLLPKPGKEKSL
jgi:CRISPR type I-E-associated protein CasA/Cse1